MFYVKQGFFNEGIVRVEPSGDVSYIPDDLENTDYQAYLAWVAEGNTPEPWPPVS